MVTLISNSLVDISFPFLSNSQMIDLSADFYLQSICEFDRMTIL